MRKQLFLGVCIFFIAIFGIIAFRYFDSFQEVTIKYESSDIKIAPSIYRYSHDNDKELNESDKINKSVTNNVKLRLKKGEYKLISKGDQDYHDSQLIFNVGNNKSVVNFNPSFSDLKLTALLEIEQPNIKDTLLKNYPSINALYRVAPGKLLDHGDWYITTLIPLSQEPSNSDNLKVVIQKKNTSWVLVTKPPDIVISKLRYPNIPKNILDEANNL
ncbi:MAG: hypothetical protein WCO19_04540 [Candidatus Saccharibacteria bacterium]